MAQPESNPAPLPSGQAQPESRPPPSEKAKDVFADEKKGLSVGRVKELFEGGGTPDGGVFQIVGITVLAAGLGPGAPARHRVQLSDGAHFLECMLSTPLNERVAKGEFPNLCVVSLQKSEVRKVTDDRKILIAKEMQMVSAPLAERIGNPVDIAPPNSAPEKRKAPDSGFASDGRGEKKGSTRRLTAISDLNVHLGRWAIRGRITKKTEMKTWSNNRGDGRFFSVELLDVGGGQIRATMFNKQAEKFYDDMEIGGVYEIANGQLKTIDKSKSWNRSATHQCEISFTSETEVQRVPDDPTIQNERYDFVKIRDIANMDNKETVDLLGIVMECSPLGEIISKKNKPVKRRTVVVRDDTDLAIEVTLWGTIAAANEFETNDPTKLKVVAFKGLEVTNFGGKSLSMSFGGSLTTSPDIKEAKDLKVWWDTVADQKQTPTLLTNGSKKGGISDEVRATIEEIETQKLGYGDKPDYVTLRVNITQFQWSMERLPWYKACQKEVNNGPEGTARACAKKVEENEDGQYICVGCGPVHDYKHRYMLNCQVADATGSAIVTAFDEIATQLMGGKTADELAAHIDKNEREQVTNAFKTESDFPYWILKCRVKTEETRSKGPSQRIHIITAKPIDFARETALINPK